MVTAAMAAIHSQPDRAHPDLVSTSSIYPPEKVTFADLNDVGPALISPDGSRLAFVGKDDIERTWG